MEHQETMPAVIDIPVGITLSRPPEIVLEEAQKAAKALRDVVSQKARPVIFNGEQYLEFEDLQTLGRFYGVTARVVGSTFIELGGARGWEAVAVAVRADGKEISRAEAMTMNDEPNWKGKPLFQLRSMAQTRACAKALRNVLAWVVVLAGYRPTPAEEMQGTTGANEGTPSLATPAQLSAIRDLAKRRKATLEEILEGALGYTATIDALKKAEASAVLTFHNRNKE